jgi:hypothetical protein
LGAAALFRETCAHALPVCAGSAAKALADPVDESEEVMRIEAPA